MSASDTTPITASFDIFSKISGWFADWSSGTSSPLSTLVAALQLGETATTLEVTGKINGSINNTTNVITVTYGQITFMNVNLVISSLIIDPTTYKVTLTATPLANGSVPYSLSDSLPLVHSLTLIEGLITVPSFTYELEATGASNATIKKSKLSFEATIATSGSDLKQEASDFLAFFGKTGIAQQFLYAFEGGAIGDGIDLSGSIDFASPIATEFSGNVPNVQLTASLTGGTDSFTLFDFLTVQNPRLSFTTVSSEEKDKTSGNPQFAAIEPTFDMDLVIGNDSDPIKLKFSAGAPPALGSITLTATNEAVNPITLNQIFDLMGGSSWEGMIPGPLQDVINDVGLQRFSANIRFPDAADDHAQFKLEWLTVEAVTTSSLTLPAPLSDCKCTAVWTIFDPTEAAKRHTTIDFHATSNLTLGSNPALQLALTIKD